MSKIDRDVFNEQLALISDFSIREFTRLCIMSAPDYFFSDCPASSSGKHHPIDELGWDGCIIHTKKVFVVGYTLARGLGIEEDRDAILASCLIHDLVKQGFKKTGFTVKNHPKLAADLVAEVQDNTQMLDIKAYETIYNSVLLHYGPWSTKAVKKPMTEYSLSELCVYMSDYVASKKFVKVTYKGDVYES